MSTIHDNLAAGYVAARLCRKKEQRTVEIFTAAETSARDARFELFPRVAY
jgi:hypothetical protein